MPVRTKAHIVRKLLQFYHTLAYQDNYSYKRNEITVIAGHPPQAEAWQSH